MNKKILISTMLAVLALLSITAVSAATTTIEVLGPNASIFIGGTILLRAEVNGSAYNHSGSGNPDTANITGVTWEFSTDGGTNWYVAATNRSNVNNGSISNWTADLNTLNLSDSNVTRWRALARNGTSGNNTRATSAEIASVTVDNTVPVISFASAANTVFTTDLTTFTATVANASTCRVKFGTDNRLSFAMTKSSDTCTYVLNKNIIPDETYSVVVTGNDGTNSTAPARSFTLSLRSGDVVTGQVGATAVVQAAQTAQQQSQNQKFLLYGAVIVIIFLALKNGKK